MRKIDKEAFRDFANTEVYWYGKNDRPVVNYNDVLQTILAKNTRRVERLARERFGITDKDFQKALKETPPGMFISKEQWEQTNHRIGITPPLPYPQIDIQKELEELKEFKEQKRLKTAAG